VSWQQLTPGPRRLARSAQGPDLRILILNWRDAHHPRAGGAEFHTHQIARRLVEAGDEVEWFAASFPGALPREVVDGIRIVRKGRQWTVHLHAFRQYRGRLRGHFDLVIDQVNTIPFFTPLWADIPVYMMIWQLAKEVWWYESRFPINVVGYVLEPAYLLVYRQTSVLTYSQSTKADLRGLGFKADITVVPVGIDPVEVVNRPKSKEPTFVYVGRLAPSKRVHEIVEAFALFLDQGPKIGRLLLIGNGEVSYVSRLGLLAHRLGVSESIEFCGWLNGPEKQKRMAEAHALVMASAREGWGLVVTECNACGTPAVVYDVPGLRDSVRHLETGLVVPPHPRCLADGIHQLLGDADLYGRLQRAANQWSRALTYEAGTRVIRQKLYGLLDSEFGA
jgi:glycosyltransferase involved in cell wall biosynthesis